MLATVGTLDITANGLFAIASTEGLVSLVSVLGSLYPLTTVALVLFARRVTFLVRLLLKGKPAARWDHLPARVGKVLVYVIGQARLIGGDFWPGLMHATIFWGFIILTLGTVDAQFEVE